MDELKCVVSAPFKKNFASSLSVKDFEFSLAFDLKWFSPEKAARVKDMALAFGLLSIKDGKLVPGFDVDSVRVPRVFRPSEELLEGGAGSVPETAKEFSVEEIIDFIVANTGQTKQRVVSEVNAMQERLSFLVDIRVVALFVARKLGCDIRDIYGPVFEAVSASF